MAPEFPITEVWRDLVTDQALLARASLLSVHSELVTASGARIEPRLRIDTGAPFSILPYWLWNTNRLSWRLIGTELYTSAGQLDRAALTWLGVPCSLGLLQIRLIDEFRQRSRPLRLIAKLPARPVAPHLEKMGLIGYNFLADNQLPLALKPAQRVNAGILTNIVGHITVA